MRGVSSFGFLGTVIHPPPSPPLKGGVLPVESPRQGRGVTCRVLPPGERRYTDSSKFIPLFDDLFYSLFLHLEHLILAGTLFLAGPCARVAVADV